MQIKKRSLPIYIVLNCLTLGIYGVITCCQIGKEINYLCKGDGEQPAFGYMGAAVFRSISTVIGIIIGLIFGLSGMSFFGMESLIGGSSLDSLYYIAAISSYYTAIRVAYVVFMITICGSVFTVFGSLISGIYLKYWWYKQAGRLKLNGGRYGLEIRESGTDNFLFHTVIEIFLIPITAILMILAQLIPMLILWFILKISSSAGAILIVSILSLLFSLPIMFSRMELTAGSYFAIHFVFKNLNRYSDALRSGVQPAQFDPMAYEYYPSAESLYPNFLPNMCGGSRIPIVDDPPVDPPPPPTKGSVYCEAGSCAGYTFDVSAGETIVIGKDAKTSNIVIDKAYQEVSRTHVSVVYDAIHDMYRVTDYSSNGTIANGEKMVNGQETFLSRGSRIALANEKNVFVLL